MDVHNWKYNPYRIVDMFEEEISNYTGAPYAIAVDNCTDAIFLCCKYLNVAGVMIPSKTYLSVPQSIIHAGGRVVFDTSMNDWSGIYQLRPYPIYDAAKRFTYGMYINGSYMCLSFHDKKILPIGKGGMILTDNKKANDWFKLARYEGRNPMLYHDDDIQEIGYNMYMTPEQAARGLVLLRNVSKFNKDLEEKNGYKDLMEFSVFKNFDTIGND